MASFEPGSQDANVGSINRFYPPSFRSGAADLYEGAGTAIKNLAALGDNFFENTINNEANVQTHIVEDANNSAAQAIVNPEGFAKTAAEGGPIPDAISEKTVQAQGLTQAKGAGKLNDANYWAQMDLIARNLRTQYPGYKEYVDNTIAKITGQIPANALHKALDAQLQAMGQNQNNPATRAAHLEDEYVKEGGALTPEYRNINDPNQKLLAIQDMQTNMNAYKARDKALASGLAVQKTQGEVNNQQAASGYQQLATSQLMNFTTKLKDSPEGRQIQPLIDQIKTLNDQSESGVATPAQRQELAAKLRSVHMLFSQNVLAPMEAKFGANVPPTTLAEVRKNSEAWFENYIGGITGNHANLLTAGDDILKVRQNYSDSLLLGTDEMLGRLGSVQRVGGGPNVASSLLMSGSVGTPILRTAANFVTGGVVSGEHATVNDALQELSGRFKQDDPKGYKAVMDNVKGWIFNPKATADGVQRGVESLYSPENTAMITNLKPAMRIDAFTNLVNGKTMEGLTKLHDDGKITDQHLKGAFNWTYSTAQGLINNKVADLNEAAVTSGKFSLDYDPTLMMLKLRPTTDAERAATENSGNYSNAVQRGISTGSKIVDQLVRGNVTEDKANDAVGDINRVLLSVQNAAKAEGADPAKIIPAFLQAAQVKVGAAKEPAQGLENLYSQLTNKAQVQAAANPGAAYGGGLANKDTAPIMPSMEDFHQMFAWFKEMKDKAGSVAAMTAGK